jgi:hypothetical protein
MIFAPPGTSPAGELGRVPALSTQWTPTGVIAAPFHRAEHASSGTANRHWRAKMSSEIFGRAYMQA